MDRENFLGTFAWKLAGTKKIGGEPAMKFQPLVALIYSLIRSLILQWQYKNIKTQPD
jgi:hypothetical protein